jgi:hypothetical protein
MNSLGEQSEDDNSDKCNQGIDTSKNKNVYNNSIERYLENNSVEDEDNTLIWDKYNREFEDILRPLEDELDNNKITAEDAETKFYTLISTFLESKPEVKKKTKINKTDR